MDLNDIRLLMHVFEQGSLSAASRVTGVPKSTISQRIAALERAAGTGLLRRTSRSFSLTEAGQRLLPHAHEIDELSRRVQIALLESGPELQGTLRISASQALAQFALSPLVPQFLALYPRVAVRVEATNNRVDIIGEGFDMALQGHKGRLNDSTLIQRLIGRTAWWMAASPGWIREHGELQVPEELVSHGVLYWSTRQDCVRWQLTNGSERREIALNARVISNDMAALGVAARAGGGVACLPAYVLRSALEAGKLVRVLQDWEAEPTTISVLTPPKSQSSKLASTFSNFLAAELPRLIVGRCSAPVDPARERTTPAA